MTVPTTKNCLTCGEEFAPRAAGKPQVRCSEKCRRKAANAAYLARRAPERATTCAECGGPVRQLERGRPRRFCSEKCRHRAGNTRHRRALPPLRIANPEMKACAHCGTFFTPKRRDRIYCYDKYCAQAAYQARGTGRLAERVQACDGCGAEFTTVRPEARWCSKACANRHWGNVRARQRGKPSEVKYTDREIFERDRWICHLCRKPVRRDVPRLDPEGATIDHLVPTSLGGPDEPSNVACAHWKCNRDKRAKAMGEQLALL